MLTVPTLKPGEQPFDPDLHLALNPSLHPGNHSLSLSSLPPSPNLTPDESHLQALLNQAVVKQAVTNLHREDDQQMKKLDSYEGIQICDIVKDHQLFLKSQSDVYAAECKNATQKRIFQEMTREYFSQSLERARRLQYRKIQSYWEEVVLQQNEEFLERTLRDDTLYNDVAVTTYRDMILYNLETLLSELPEKEKKEKLDAAAQAFYRKVLEKRMVTAPQQVYKMLNAKEVCRVLGDKEVTEYRKQTRKAERDDEIRLMAKKWVDDGIEPAEAKRRGKSTFTNPEESLAFQEYYEQIRAGENAQRCFATIMNIGQTWQSIRDGGYTFESIPEWTRRTEPELYSFLCRSLIRWGDSGGKAWGVAWKRLVHFLKDFSIRRELEKLRDKEKCYSLVTELGGPESEIWAYAMRHLLGRSTEEDGYFFQDVIAAWGEGKDDAFMDAFYRERALREKPGAVEVQEILTTLTGAPDKKTDDL